MSQEYHWLDNLYSEFRNSSGVSTDTRTITEGSIFFSLRGPSFDGNQYADQALKNGAKLAVIDDPELIGERKFLVKNSLEALQLLANRYRQDLDARVLGIGGSNGKTTTKGLVKAILSEAFEVFATPGNFNNHIGLPLTILSCPINAEILVLEMGANHQGEHRDLLRIGEPDVLLVTNIGKDHLEGFEGFEGVIAATSEFFEFSTKESCPIYFFGDQDEFKGIRGNGISFGRDVPSDIRGDYEFGESGLIVKTMDPDHSFQSNLIGNFNFGNILGAIAIGKHFGLDNEKIEKGVRSFFPESNRSQIIEKNRLKIFMDCYNANPTSMAASINSFFQDFQGPWHLLLGGMKELGDYTENEHREILDLAKSKEPRALYLVGSEFSFAKGIAGVVYFENFNEIRKEWQKILPKAGALLVKGSRSYNLEKLFE